MSYFEKRVWKKNRPRSNYQFVKAVGLVKNHISKFRLGEGGREGLFFAGSHKLLITHQESARYLAVLQVLRHH